MFRNDLQGQLAFLAIACLLSMRSDLYTHKQTTAYSNLARKVTVYLCKSGRHDISEQARTSFSIFTSQDPPKASKTSRNTRDKPK